MMEDDGVECPICYERFDENETRVDLGCDHVFHSACIVKWLVQKDSCPMCRSKVANTVYKNLGIQQDEKTKEAEARPSTEPEPWDDSQDVPLEDIDLVWDDSFGDTPLEETIDAIASEGLMEHHEIRSQILEMLAERRLVVPM